MHICPPSPLPSLKIDLDKIKCHLQKMDKKSLNLIALKKNFLCSIN